MHLDTHVCTHKYLHTRTPNSHQVECRIAIRNIMLRIFLSVLNIVGDCLRRNSVSVFAGIFTLTVKSPSIPTSAQGHYTPFLAEEER